MSLTTDALDDRKWGPYPVLRSVPHKKEFRFWETASSAQDHILTHMSRGLHTAMLALENEQEILRADLPTRAVIEELHRLEKGTERAREIVEDIQKQLRRMIDRLSSAANNKKESGIF